MSVSSYGPTIPQIDGIAHNINGDQYHYMDLDARQREPSQTVQTARDHQGAGRDWGLLGHMRPCWGAQATLGRLIWEFPKIWRPLCRLQIIALVMGALTKRTSNFCHLRP